MRIKSGIRVIIFKVAILGFISDISNSITNITVPLLAVKLGASYEFIGFMVALSTFTRLILVQLVGWLGDKHGKKNFLILGFTFFLFNFIILFFG